MMTLFEAAWVIARRDFIAIVYSRSFILFLLAPLFIVVVASILFGIVSRRRRRAAPAASSRSSPTPPTSQALSAARARLVAGTAERALPDPAPRRPGRERRGPGAAPARRRGAGYSAVFSGTLERPVLTGPTRIDEIVGAAHRTDRP